MLMNLDYINSDKKLSKVVIEDFVFIEELPNELECLDKKKTKTDLPCLNIYYDLETILNDDGYFEPYQVGYIIEKDDPQIISSYDCIRIFMNIIKNLCIENKGRMINLISYNGSRFDDFFIQKFCLENEIRFDFIAVKNSLLSLTIPEFGLRCFDLNRHLIGSLSGNCKDFRTVNQKVENEGGKAYDHHTLQTLYEKGADEFMEMISSDEKATKYLHGDVLCLRELFELYSTTLMNLYDDFIKQVDLSMKQMKLTEAENYDKVYEKHCKKVKKQLILTNNPTIGSMTKALNLLCVCDKFMIDDKNKIITRKDGV